MQSSQPTSRAIAIRPTPRSSQDARAVELAQLQRRFRASFMILEKSPEATSVRIEIPPSDPDFPYELEALSLHIRIPANYPTSPCSIQVTNPEISRGFASNLENGFDQHQKVQPSHRTLVQEMTWLDNNMENLLQAPPAPTIRFIPNTPKQQQSPSPAAETTIIEEAQPATPKYTIKQIEEAKDKREAEIRKLQAKFRNELSDVSKDLTSKILLIKLPLNAECHFKEQLEGFISIEMAIPAHYPLDPCRIKIANTGDLEPWRARSVEEGFASHSLVAPTTLFQQLNWLNTNLNALLSAPEPAKPAAEVVKAPGPAQVTSPPAAKAHFSHSQQLAGSDLDRKDKKLYIERPLDPVSTAETSQLQDEQGDNSGSDSDEGSSESDRCDDEVSIKMAETGISSPQQVRTGTEIRFHDLRLENVALLRCSSMFIMVKCSRCSGTVEVENIVPEQAAVDSVNRSSQKYQRWLPCPTCSSLIGVLFKGNYLHTNSITLGLLQLASCTPFDLLPSTYIATCANCMEPHVPLKLTVHDQPKSTACHHCHTKMSIGIPNCQFVRFGSGTGSKELRADPNAILKLKKKNQPKQDLGLVVGEPLPKHGVCDHYRKSKRWFRFSCCNRIYACDRCHNEKEDHETEIAKTHICGYCSREFATSRSVCVCGNEPGKSQTGMFWEGGEGTRNKNTMNRKDKHKYSGSKFKTSSKKQQRVGEAGKKTAQSKAQKRKEP